ncbi:Interferon-induced protein with tetratricopeptide repeats 5 [Holothuria leucospilota]|uniref:Interferon-induced protein with tetratricopeptide repeats 5 n=1 Tax=Holothuria leucospilota TaxID=206669 RepID=A0A9Q1BU00_HOLLE|nr:Interferon-induced protein with tetratricopeptide repeats 5 [Holothuria leucospilota]
MSLHKSSENKMETVSKEGSKWWHEVECHFSSRWGLPNLDQYMLDTIKDTNRFELDLTILPDFMTIERLLFSAWIQLSNIIFTEEASSSEAVQLVQKAKEYLNNNSDKLGDGSLIGYGTIIQAFFVWIYHKSGLTKKFKEAQEKLKGLWNNDPFQSDPEKPRPDYQVFVDVTHAWTLGRLGPEKICKALRLLDNALKVKKKNHFSEQWLFAKALIQDRVAREDIYIDKFQSNDPNLSKMLEKKKQTIEQVVGKNKPGFDLAKAYLGTVMAALDNTGKNEKRALKFIKESVGKDCDDAELALILTKLCRDLRKTEMLQDILQYCETNVEGENRPSNVYFHFGLLYYNQSKSTDDTSMMDKALTMVQKATTRDKNHTQARLWEAMILVNPQINNSKNSKRAREIHAEILKEKYNSATELHILRSISSVSFSSIYERLQYLQNVFQFLFFCVKHHAVKDYLGNVDFETVVRNDADERMKILEKETKSDSDEGKTKSTAIQYLAEICLHLERYKMAEHLFKLLRNEVFFRNELDTEVECGLAKCLYRLGKFQELRELNVVNREGDVGETSREDMKEIQGLIYLAEGKEKQQEMMAKCEDAIELGSLDGCLLMLNMHQHFQEKFFVFRERFAHRLAKIKLCTTRNMNDTQQASNQVQKQTDKYKVKQMIADKIDVILKYSRKRKVFDDNHESVYKKFNEIRCLLLDFEYCLLVEEKHSCSTEKGFLACLERKCIHTKVQSTQGTTSNWSDNCRKAAEVVLNKVRFLLDEVMSCLQIAVLGQKHSRSEFPIIVDWKEGLQDREKATVQLQTRLSQLFPGGYELYIPDVLFDSLLKSWNLKLATKRDEKKLKERIENLLQVVPDFMPIEGNVFRAWLDVSSLYLQNSKQSHGTALKYLEKAEAYLQDIASDKNAFSGYGMVVYAFFMWIYNKVTLIEEFKRAEQKLLNIFQEGFSGDKLRPGAHAYVHATRAFALSRLGAEHRRQSLNLFEKALKKYPDAKHWLFCKARIQYRCCIMKRTASYSFQEEPLSRLQKDKFIEVKSIIKRILKIDPGFHWAKVYLAHVSLILDRNNTSYETLVDDALKDNRKTSDVALMACKVYKERKDFMKCLQTLERLDEHLKTSEVYHQLGITFYELWKRTEDKRQESFFKDASIKNLKEAIERDSCNFPAFLKYAEMVARKAKTDPSCTKEAKTLYIDVFSKGRDLPTNDYHGRRSATYDEVRHIFSPMQQVDNIYQFFLAAVREAGPSRYDNGKLVIPSGFQSFVERCRTKLRKISNAEEEYDYKDEHIQLRAKVYLADCERTLGNIQGAISLYKTVNRNRLEQTEKSDVNIGLVKCYCCLNSFNDATIVAESEVDPEIRNELLADIFVCEARQLQDKMLDKYEEVADMGFLEGCLELIMGNGNLQEDFFSVAKQTAQRLAQVKVCLDDAERKAETKFDLKKFEVVQKLAELLELTLVHPDGRKKPVNGEVFVDAGNSLTNLRSSLLEFECELLSDISTSVCSTENGSILCARDQCARKEGRSHFGEECRKKAKTILPVEDYLRSRQSATFPIVPRISENVQKEEGDLSSELQELLVLQFPNDTDAYIPSEVFECLLKEALLHKQETFLIASIYLLTPDLIQPKFDKRNIWLQVLSDVVSKTTDANVLPDETYRIIPNDSNSQTMCTVNLVRKSCEEAEKMLLTIFQQCQGLMD